jgi:hypothetical protein
VRAGATIVEVSTDRFLIRGGDAGFHVTLMLAGIILAYFFLTILRRHAGIVVR